MKDKITAALERVASLSSEAEQLVASLAETTELSRLRQALAVVTMELATLKAPQQHTPIGVSTPSQDEEDAAFVASFKEMLARNPDPKGALRHYAQGSVLAAQSPKVRLLMAKALLSFCAERHLHSSDIWSSLVDNAGYL